MEEAASPVRIPLGVLEIRMFLSTGYREGVFHMSVCDLQRKVRNPVHTVSQIPSA